MSFNQRISPNLSETPSTRQAPACRQAGFTLIELMVVIAILGVLMAIGGTSWTTYRESTKVDSAKEKIVSILQQARLKALTSGFDEVVTFDWAANTVSADGKTVSMDKGIDLKGYICSSATAYNTGVSTFKFQSSGGFSSTYSGGVAISEVQVSAPGSNKVFYIKAYTVTGRIASGEAC